MSLFDIVDLIEIKLYYKYVSFNGSKKIHIIDDSKAEEILKDPEKEKEIECLVTKWSMMNWKEQNDILSASTLPTGPSGEKQFNFLVYRDAVVKRCLKEWDITVNQKPVPITKDAIDKLPGNIVFALYKKFEKVIDYSEDDLGN